MKSTSRSQQVFSIALIAIGAIITVADAKPPSRISGAFDAPPGVFTYLVEIALWGYVDHPQHRCGGAIITDRLILTAGHCLENDDVRKYVVFGGIVHLRDPNPIAARIERSFLHPEFKPKTKTSRMENDIAILELDKPLDLGGRLTKISLPTAPPRNHQRGIVAGWGYTNNKPIEETLSLKATYVTFIDDKECRQWRDAVRPHFFCGLQESGNVLGGDSGSPLVSEGVVIGIASSTWGKIYSPDFYTNVYDYRDWINSVIANSSSTSNQHKSDGPSVENVIFFPADR